VLKENWVFDDVLDFEGHIYEEFEDFLATMVTQQFHFYIEVLQWKKNGAPVDRAIQICHSFLGIEGGQTKFLLNTEQEAIQTIKRKVEANEIDTHLFDTLLQSAQEFYTKSFVQFVVKYEKQQKENKKHIDE